MHHPTNRARCTISSVSSAGGRSSLRESITESPRFLFPPGTLYISTWEDTSRYLKQLVKSSRHKAARGNGQTSLSLLSASASAGSEMSFSVSSNTSSSNWASNSWGSDRSGFLLCAPLQMRSPWEDVHSRIEGVFDVSLWTGGHDVRRVLGTRMNQPSRRLIPRQLWYFSNNRSHGTSWATECFQIHFIAKSLKLNWQTRVKEHVKRLAKAAHKHCY